MFFKTTCGGEIYDTQKVIESPVDCLVLIFSGCPSGANTCVVVIILQTAFIFVKYCLRRNCTILDFIFNSFGMLWTCVQQTLYRQHLTYYGVFGDCRTRLGFCLNLAGLSDHQSVHWSDLNLWLWPLESFTTWRKTDKAMHISLTGPRTLRCLLRHWCDLIFCSCQV